MAMLEVRDLEVYYGVIQALKGISFDVNQGGDRRSDRCQRCRKDDNTAHRDGSFERPFRTYHVRRNRYHKDPRLQARQHGNRPVPEGRRVFSTLTVLQNLKPRCLHKKR